MFLNSHRLVKMQISTNQRFCVFFFCLFVFWNWDHLTSIFCCYCNMRFVSLLVSLFFNFHLFSFLPCPSIVYLTSLSAILLSLFFFTRHNIFICPSSFSNCNFPSVAASVRWCIWSLTTVMLIHLCHEMVIYCGI